MIGSNRILIVDEMHESIGFLLKNAGFTPDYKPDIRRNKMLSEIADCFGLIIRNKTTVDRELVDAGSELRFVARAGAGIDKLDEKYLMEKNIHIINAPEGNRDSLGEHTLGMLLSLMHNINVADCEIKRGIWRRKENRGIELKGKTIGLYGYGHMGGSFAEKLKGMSCEVIAYDKYRFGFSDEHVTEVVLEELMKRTEILSIHVPFTDETKFMFDRDYLMKFSKIKILLNTARGEIVRLKDVLDILEKDILCGLGLDVLENEKMDTYSQEENIIFEKLKSHKNVILTPHVAGWTHESYIRINEIIVDKIVSLNSV